MRLVPLFSEPDVNFQCPRNVTAKKEHENQRNGVGRRDSDDKKIEVHPIALSIVGGLLSVVLMVLGYFFKSWGDNVTYEIHQLRIVVQEQVKESAANNEWKSDMGRWRDNVDEHFHSIDDQLSANKRARRYQQKAAKLLPSTTTDTKSKP
jgi:hypothetical protein